VRFSFASALLAVMSASSATAADVRAVDIGSSCSTIRESEIALGSKEIPWKPIEGRELIAFSGQAFNREFVIVYYCRNDTLFTVNFSLPFEPTDRAVLSFRAVYDELVATYGPPDLGNQHRNFASWRRLPLHVTASLMSKEHALGLGQVFVVFSRTPL
jgi:hypothetical protein